MFLPRFPDRFFPSRDETAPGTTEHMMTNNMSEDTHPTVSATRRKLCQQPKRYDSQSMIAR